MIGSKGVKRKGRGKGKGIKGHGITIEVHDNRSYKLAHFSF